MEWTLALTMDFYMHQRETFLDLEQVSLQLIFQQGQSQLLVQRFVV